MSQSVPEVIDTDELSKKADGQETGASFKDKGTAKAKGSGPGLKPLEWYWDEVNTFLRSRGGSPLPDTWRITAKQRDGTLSVDVYYLPPEGGKTKLRSKPDVARYFGLPVPEKTVAKAAPSKPAAGHPTKPAAKPAQEPATKSLEEACASAQEAFKAFELPRKLASGVTITSLGEINAEPGFHSAKNLWPIGYTTQMNDRVLGTFICSIKGDAKSGPQFSVTLQMPDGRREELAVAGSPDAVWKDVCKLQERARSGEPSAGESPALGKPDTGAVMCNGVGLHGKEPETTDIVPADSTIASKTQEPVAGLHGDEIKTDPSPKPDASGAGAAILGSAELSGKELTADAMGESRTGGANAAESGGRQPLWKALGKISQLDKICGLERFGLADEVVLKAIEGMPGVENCKSYKYVEERGSWEAHMARLQQSRRKATAVKTRGAGKPAAGSGSQKMTSFFPQIGSGKLKSPKRKREEGASPDKPYQQDAQPKTRAKSGGGKAGGKDKTEAEVAKVVQGLLRDVEKSIPRLEKKRAIEQKKKDAADAKQAQKQERSRRSDMASAAVVQTKPDLGKDVEDSQLPDAGKQPPQPQAFPGADCLPASVLPGLLELRELLGRFSESLGLAEVPSLTELAEAAANPGSGGQDPFNNAMASLTDLLANEAFEAALEVASSSNNDVKARDLSAALPNAQDDTWPEIARRLFLLAAVGTMVQQSKGQASGGLDVALGPLVGSSPLGALGPSIILQGLVAAALPPDPQSTTAALPVAACHAAPAALTARLDAHALRAAEEQLSSQGDDKTLNSTGAAKPFLEPNTIVMCRRVLLHLNAVRGPKNADGVLSKLDVLYHGGEEAAIAASGKLPRPLDLHTVASRVDNGLYASMRNGVAVFAADVRYVCHLFQAAAGNRKSDFAHSLQSKRVPQVAAEVLSKLDSLTGPAAAGTLQLPSGKKLQSAAPSREGSDAEEDGAAVYDKTADLASPLQMGNGCSVCWVEEGKSILCSSCDDEYHIYCLNPPLPYIPEEDWFCATCHAEGEGRKATPLYQQKISRPRSTISADTYLRAAFHLESQEYLIMSPEDRVSLACLLATLAEGSMAVREALERDETERKELRKELNDLRVSIKRVESEMHEAEQQEKERERVRAEKAMAKARGAQVDDVPQPRRRTRAEEQAADKLIADRERQERIQSILQVEARSVRAEPLGYDRHWNRYWLLDCFGHDELGTVFVEQRDRSASMGQKAALGPMADLPHKLERVNSEPYAPAGWGIYSTEESLQFLVNFMNFRGRREGPLKKALKQHLTTVRERPKQPPVPAVSAPVPSKIPALEEADGGATSALPGQNDNGGLEEPGSSAAATASKEAAPPVRKDELDNSAHSGHAEPDRGVGLADGDSQTAATSAKDAAEGAADDKMDDVEVTTSGFARLAGEIAGIVNALGPESLDPARGSQQRLEHWRRLLTKASTPQDLMAAALLAEGFIRPERLKPWWRLWAYPAPHIASAGTLSAVRLRVERLASAVRKGPPPRGLAAAEAPEPRATRLQGGRVLRERTHIRTYAEDLGPEDFEDDDAAYARKVDAEINSGSRSTRARDAPAVSGGGRATRAARRAQEGVSVPKTKSQLRNTARSSASSETSGESQVQAASVSNGEGEHDEASGGTDERPQTHLVEGRRRLHKAA